MERSWLRKYTLSARPENVGYVVLTAGVAIKSVRVGRLTLKVVLRFNLFTKADRSGQFMMDIQAGAPLSRNLNQERTCTVIPDLEAAKEIHKYVRDEGRRKSAS
nr:hypothetical protein Iba_chr15aCG12110 [Ipomoea batatas]